MSYVGRPMLLAEGRGELPVSLHSNSWEWGFHGSYGDGIDLVFVTISSTGVGRSSTPNSIGMQDRANTIFSLGTGITGPALLFKSEAGGVCQVLGQCLHYFLVVYFRALSQTYELCALHYGLMFRQCADFLNKVFGFPRPENLTTVSKGSGKNSV